MKIREVDLLEIVAKFQNASIAVVGDLFVDHYIWGKVNRISPEAPVVVVNVTSEDRRLGGAGNVARNIAVLGGKVSMFGVVGDDDPGHVLLELLEGLGADTEGVLVDRSRETIQKTRVIAHSQQVVRIDHEIIKPLGSTYAEGMSSALQAKLSSVQGVIVSDYGKGTVCSQIFDRLPTQKGKNGETLPVLVDPKAPNFGMYRNATIIKPNRSEAAEASGIAIKNRVTAAEAGRKLLQAWGCGMILITLGEDGMVLVSSTNSEEPVIEVDTVAQEVYDVSGAGDTVSAVFLLALAVSATPHQAAVLANMAAGIVVAEVGTVAVTLDQLKKKIQEAKYG